MFREQISFERNHSVTEGGNAVVMLLSCFELHDAEAYKTLQFKTHLKLYNFLKQVQMDAFNKRKQTKTKVKRSAGMIWAWYHSFGA